MGTLFSRTSLTDFNPLRCLHLPILPSTLMHDLNAWQLTRLTLAIAHPVLNPFDPTPFPSVSSRVLPETTQQSQTPGEERANELEIDPEILEGSPVLQEWLQDVPDVMEEIRHDRSFRTRVRFGYSQFSSTDDEGGFHVGIEDIFIGKTGLTVSGEYQQTFNDRDRRTWGGDVRYYVLPLGSYLNIAPVVGYRNIETIGYSTDGINVGMRLMLALSRSGAADISLTQSFVSPSRDDEVGITTLSFGYAVTANWRLSTEIQKQNSRADKESRVGIRLEWMP